MLSVRDLARQIPAEWQENVKHRRELTLRPLPRAAAGPRAQRAGSPAGSGACRRSPRSSTGGAPTCRRSRCTWSRCPRPGSRRPCCGSASSRSSACATSTSTSRASAPTPRSARPETALVRRINHRVNHELEPPDYRPLVRELLAHQTLSRRTEHAAADPAARPAGVGHRALAAAGSRSSRRAGTTCTATSTTSSAPTPRRTPGSTPTTPTRRSWPTRVSTRSGPCCWRACGSPASATGCGRARRRAPPARARAPAPDLPRAARGRARLQHSRPGRGLLRVYRWVRGRSSRSA